MAKAGRPKVDLKEAFTQIQPYLQLGYSLSKACQLGKYPYTTLIKYYNNDQDFRLRIDNERLKPNLQARANIIKAIKDGDTKISVDWLERMEKDEFGKVQIVENVASEGILLLRSIIQDKRGQIQEGEVVEGKKDE